MTLVFLLLGCGVAETAELAETNVERQAVTAPDFATLTSQFNTVDLDGDGIREITKLKLMQFEEVSPSYANAFNGVVLVIVESRLLSQTPTGPAPVLSSLEKYKKDLIAEGYYPRFIEAEVYSGTQHQDGRTMLALRRFFIEAFKYYKFRGAVLVGNFPDTTLVRRVMFRSDGVTKDLGGAHLVNASTLTVSSEQIAIRADLVLSDLDGNWEALYDRGPRTYRNIESSMVTGKPAICGHFKTGQRA